MNMMSVSAVYRVACLFNGLIRRRWSASLAAGSRVCLYILILVIFLTPFPPLFFTSGQEAMAVCDLELDLSPRQLCDVELICNGGFSPLTGFMTQDEYLSVVESNRLPNGLLFGLPVVYDTDREDIKPGKHGTVQHSISTNTAVVTRS